MADRGKIGLPELDPALRDRRTASDYVADALREAIFDGRFADGEELNQVELANHFNVSRVPVREALRRLQAEGLVSAEAHRRAVVIGLGADRIAEIFELRQLLEGHMLEKAAPALTSADLVELRRLCDRIDRTPDHAAWLVLNREFHGRLLRVSGARTTMALVEQLTAQVERYLRRSGGMARTAKAGEEHRRLLDALERGKVSEARRILEQHIGQTYKDLVSRWRAGDEGTAL